MVVPARLIKDTHQLRQRLPMPRMRAVSACADIGCIGFRDSKRRSQSGDRNRRESRANGSDKDIFAGLKWR